MPTRSDVINSLLAKYNSQIEQSESGLLETAVFKFLICQLVDKNFGGGSGGGSTSPADIALGVNQSTRIIDIDVLLANIDNSLANGSRGLLSQAQVTTAINNALDIDTLIALLTSINNALDINTLITLLTSIDTNTKIANSISISTVPTSPTINTSTQLVSLNSNRKYLFIQNLGSAPVFITTSEIATINNGIRIAANGGAQEFTSASAVPTSAIQIICSVPSNPITIMEG